MWSQAYVNRSGVGPVGAHSRAPESLHSRAPEGPARDVALSPGDSATLLDQAVSKPTTLRSGPEWLGAPESGRASAATTLRLCGPARLLDMLTFSYRVRYMIKPESTEGQGWTA